MNWIFSSALTCFSIWMMGSDEKEIGDRKSWKSGAHSCPEYLHMQEGSRGCRESLVPEKSICYLGDGDRGGPGTIPGEYTSYFLMLSKKWGLRHRASAGTLSLAAGHHPESGVISSPESKLSNSCKIFYFTRLISSSRPNKPDFTKFMSWMGLPSSPCKGERIYVSL